MQAGEQMIGDGTGPYRIGRGAILALPHSGNWDLAGAALVELGHPITTVGQRLRPEALYQRFVAARADVFTDAIRRHP